MGDDGVAEVEGVGEWGVGMGRRHNFLYPIPHSPLPTPYLLVRHSHTKM